MEILFSSDQYFMMKVRINNLYVHMYNDSYNYAIDAVKYRIDMAINVRMNFKKFMYICITFVSLEIM